MAAGWLTGAKVRKAGSRDIITLIHHRLRREKDGWREGRTGVNPVTGKRNGWTREQRGLMESRPV